MRKVLDRIMNRYDTEDLAVQMKARLLFFLCLLILGIIPIVISYSAYAHLNNPDFGRRINLPILMPQIVLFFIVSGILVFLIRGYFVASVHIILIHSVHVHLDGHVFRPLIGNDPA